MDVTEYIASGKYPTLKAYTQKLKPAERPIIGREREMRGVKAALSRPELCNVILLGDAGSGKAHPNDTLVPVNDARGYVPIGKLKVGDEVFDETGKPCKVIGVFPRGLKHLFEVEFNNGAVVPCNDEHLWYVRSYVAHNKGYGYRVRELRDLVEHGIKSEKKRPCGKSYFRSNWWIPVNQAVERPEIDFPMHPYVIGCFIGDGCCSDYKKGIALQLSSDDVELVDRVADLLGSTGAVKNPHNYTWQFLAGDDACVSGMKYISRNKFAEKCGSDYDCVFRSKSVDKRIPAICFLGSIEQRMELLRGLLDTGGTLDGSDRVRVRFSTNSEGLAHDVVKLAASLGIVTSLTCQMRQDSLHHNVEYNVYFSVPEEMRPNLFHLEHYREVFERSVRTNKKFHKHYDDLAIADVRDCHKEVEMTCIMVDSPHHLYQVTERHVVTHNTALVQGLMGNDEKNLYLEVDLSKMLVGLGDKNEMASRVKNLFDETEQLVKTSGKGVILFIDEFHQIVQLSEAAVEALKPKLADSGTRGIRVIAATTYVEFRKWVAPNQPLVERLQRFNIKQPGEEVVVKILRDMAKRYGVSGQFYNDKLFELIYDYTERYVPANSQPRKSILILDAMIGWNRAEGKRLDKKLLADVIYDTEGVNVAFQVDARNIKRFMDSRVFAQEYATTVIEQRLQICVADLNNDGKPMSSFLFTGSTGVGKTEVSKTLAEIMFHDPNNLIRMDMTEYALPDSLERFRRELTNAVWARPYCIVLLDEIEKAAAPVTRVLLQVLDDGRLVDENNREVTFKNAYIIMTTNAGSEIYNNIAQYASSDTGDGSKIEKYNKLIRRSIQKTTGDNRFPPELLGRIDCIVPFQPLSRETLRKIAATKLKKLEKDVFEKHGIKVNIMKDVVKYLVDDNADTQAESGGARAIVSKLESEVTMEVARYVNLHKDAGSIVVTVEGEMAVDNVHKLESSAHIVVNAVK